ncbi:MAG: aminotransferase class V-fold PLP-dependent enzyme [Dehalogenimonas sp.]
MVQRTPELSLKTEAWGDGLDIFRVLHDPDLRQKEFPITAAKVFLAHAASSPLPFRVSEAMVDYVRRASTEGQWEYINHQIEEETRDFAALLLGAEKDEIALVASTSAGLNIVAAGLPWQSGDNVIIADGDFPANVYPWLNLQALGVQVKFIPRTEDGSVTLKNIIPLVDQRTRLVSLSSVNYLTGFQIDVPGIGAYLKGRNILFCVDAIQSAGIFPTDLKYVDFLAAGANKWLLGPLGTGILFVSKKNFDVLSPSWVGWKNVRSYNNYTAYDLCFVDSAKKYEPTPICISGMFGLHSALKMILEVQVTEIAARLADVRHRLVSILKEKGFNVLNGGDEQRYTGITSFTSPKIDIAGMRNQIDADGFVVSLRDGLTCGKYIRVGPHFYNTDDEIQRFLDNLPTLRRLRKSHYRKLN